jgi:hypothetical protein
MSHRGKQVDLEMFAQEMCLKLKTGRGMLTITDLKLLDLVPGEYAHIESMEFDVEIDF